MKIIGESPHEWPKVVFHDTWYIILFLQALTGTKNTEKSINTIRRMTNPAPLLFTMGQSIVVLWCHANILYRQFDQLS